MEVVREQSPSDYAIGPPWLFKGSALYQLHLVEADTARAFIPREFRLVEAFGYTLGGFFLAHYDDSPAGKFDEVGHVDLIVIAGIVWNPPTSCVWAARVLVNDQGACIHGRKHVGLPSHMLPGSQSLCSKQRMLAISEKPRSKSNDFLNMIGLGNTFCNPKDQMEMEISDIKGSAATAFCNINLRTPESKSDKKWMGPLIRMSLPSFRVRLVEATKISGPTTALKKDEDRIADGQGFDSLDHKIEVSAENDARSQSISVLLSKPILALEFNFLKMQVEAPTVVAF